MVKVSEHTNENDAASVSLCKPGGQFKDASNSLVGLPIIFALDIAGLDSQKEGVHMLGDGLPASALLALWQRLIKKQNCRTKAAAWQHARSAAEVTEITQAEAGTLANIVLPVPGGPYSRMPLGCLNKPPLTIAPAAAPAARRAGDRCLVRVVICVSIMQLCQKVACLVGATPTA